MTLHKEIRLSQIVGALCVLAGAGVVLYTAVRYRLQVPDAGALGLGILGSFLALLGISGLVMGRMLSVFETKARHVVLGEAVGILFAVLGIVLVGAGTFRAWPDPPSLRQLAVILAGLFSGTAGVIVLLGERVKLYERKLIKVEA